MQWGAAVGCREPGCSHHSSHSCRQAVVVVVVVGLCSPGCNLLGCRVAGCNSAGKRGEKTRVQLGWRKGLHKLCTTKELPWGRLFAG